MGVRRSDWILIGAKIDTNHFNEEWYEMDNSPLDKYDENKNIGEITYLFDGMSGEYFIIGEVIQCDHEGYNGFKFFQESDMDIKDHSKSVDRVKSHILEHFGIDANPELIILTHWT